jgi:ribose transport system substrate-binding protein
MITLTFSQEPQDKEEIKMRCTRRPMLLAASAVAAVGVLAACSSSASSPGAPQTGSSAHSASASALASVIQSELAGKTPASVSAELNQNIPLSEGQVVPGYPHGVTPSPANIFHFTAADIATLRAGHYTAAIAMHVSDAAWPNLQINGITTTLAKFGIKVVATTSAGGIASTQITQLATLITRKPTAIFSIPVDPVSEASEYKQISASGIKLVLLDNVPTGMTPGKQYVTVVSANNGGNGLFAAEQLQKQAGCGPIGVIDLDYYFPVVNTRDTAALNYLKSACPGQAQYTQGLSNLVVTPAFAEAGAMLGQHTGGIKGFWAAWNSIAEEIVSAEEAAGVKIPIATTDIDATSALEMAQGYITAVGGQQPYAQGVAEADALAYNLLGKTVPPFIELPTVPVTLADLIPAYKIVNGSAPPANVIAAIKSAAGLSS